MNTVKSFWVGWGSLCVAGGAAYYFAKKSINADRLARHETEQRRRQMMESLEYNSSISSSQSTSSTMGSSATANQEAESQNKRTREKSKYESSEPFRARKGDRFS